MLKTYNYVATRMFNLLPDLIQNTNNKNKFKINLNKWQFGKEDIFYYNVN